MSVEALKKIARQTYFWICEDDFPMYMWLAETTGLSRSEIIDRMLSGTMDSFVAEFLQQFDPVTHYKFYDEADRKRSRLFEAIESVRTSAERKKQIDTGLRYWSKQFEQTADNLVSAVVLQAYKDNGVKYVMWMIMSDAKVCDDCYRRKGKIYPVDSPLLKALHWNCRCWWIPVMS
jgi:SPP1 gp7 family putative phage head morphogenesis protein